MSAKDNWFPFYLNHDPVTEEWYVVLEHPFNRDNFVVVYRSQNFEACGPVCDSLNNLMQVHWDSREKELLRRLAAENSDE